MPYGDCKNAGISIHTMQRTILSSAALLGLSGAAIAQAIPVPLTYNFNGIVHAGESGLPDDPNGYRSISDRGLDWQGGVPSDNLLNGYTLVGTPGTLDIVHLGNRNTVSGGLWAFEPAANGNNVGTQPAWLTNVDQSTPQTTVLTQPLPIQGNTNVAFLYQISNGGGTFDVNFTFASGNSYTAQLGGGDWFGGAYLGTDSTDNGFSGANLSITEGRIDMSSQSGEVVTEISFSNQSNLGAGYAILACNFEYPVTPSLSNRIPLNYNFNGIVHTGESFLPDDPLGYRSISDRGLDFQNGVPNDPIFDDYNVINSPLALDIVHLGNRNTVDGGLRAFEPTANGNNTGTQPAWLPSADQTGPQTTLLGQPIRMDLSSAASLIFQISNGGGSFDVEFGFQTGNPVVATVSGGDWFGGSLPGTSDVDNGGGGANLNLTERNIDLSAEAGRVLTSITFSNQTNLNAGYAIVAMNVVGCLECANGAAASITNLNGGNGIPISTTSTGNLGCDLDMSVSGGTPNALGIWSLGAGTTSVPVALLTPGCPGTMYTPNPVLLTAPLDTTGGASLTLAVPANQGLCGFVLTVQHGSLGFAPCELITSDALEITIGN